MLNTALLYSARSFYLHQYVPFFARCSPLRDWNADYAGLTSRTPQQRRDGAFNPPPLGPYFQHPPSEGSVVRTKYGCFRTRQGNEIPLHPLSNLPHPTFAFPTPFYPPPPPPRTPPALPSFPPPSSPPPPFFFDLYPLLTFSPNLSSPHSPISPRIAFSPL